jgi:hypothetical protein
VAEAGRKGDNNNNDRGVRVGREGEAAVAAWEGGRQGKGGVLYS